MSRELLLWGLADSIMEYARRRLWWAMHDPLWALYEKALETDDWADYKVARAAHDEAPA